MSYRTSELKVKHFRVSTRTDDHNHEEMVEQRISQWLEQQEAALIVSVSSNTQLEKYYQYTFTTIIYHPGYEYKS